MAKPKPQQAPDLNKHRAEVLAEFRGAQALMQQLQAQANQVVGQLNAAAGKLQLINRMLGREDADTQD